MRLFSVVATALVVLSCGGSSSSNESTSIKQIEQDAGGSSDAAAEDQDGGTDAAEDSPSVVLKAPVITKVAQMAGGLHVMWTNNQADCDSIEGERKSATEGYKVAFTIPDGTVDNKHDSPLKAGMLYTYRLRCKKGSAYSPYSNEKSGTP